MTLSVLEQLYQQQSLSQSDSQAFFEQVVQGEVDPIVLSSALTALKLKGETPNEIAGAAQALIKHAAPFPTPDYAFGDIVGTGGDGHHTINISTMGAFVAASLGVKVAKHGNRSVSSKTGSSDLLAAFGLKLDLTAEQARKCLDELGLCFLFAPQYHGGIRHAMPVRTTLKTRTIFNVLGPLINPAKPTFELMGVYSADLVEPIAQTMQQLGYTNAMVVHGSGLDEIAIHGETLIARITGTEIDIQTLTPEDFGVQSAPLEALKGGTPEENRQLADAILQGKGTEAQQAAVAVNVSALLVLAGIADDLKQGTTMALEAMVSGQPRQLVDQLAALSQQEAQA